MKLLFLMVLFAFSTSAIASRKLNLEPGQWKKNTYSDDNGSKDYFTYVPTTLVAGKPAALMLMLHGCHQDASIFAADTGMNQLAEKYGFVVLYPQQDSISNMENCWNFFYSANQTRGGEPAMIVGMVDKFEKSISIDPRRIYVAGLSSGAAMADVLASCYSDVFSGAGIASGLEFESADTVPGAYYAMDNGSLMDPKTSGHDGARCAGKAAKMVRIFAIQGTHDTVVSPKNLTQVVDQFVAMNDMLDDGQDNGSQSLQPLNSSSGQVVGGRSYSIDTFGGANGVAMVEKVQVDGMDHAWSGGAQAAKWVDQSGPNASEMLWQFLSQGTK